MTVNRATVDWAIRIIETISGGGRFFGIVDPKTDQEIHDGITFLQQNETAAIELVPILEKMVELNTPLVNQIIAIIRKHGGKG